MGGYSKPKEKLNGSQRIGVSKTNDKNVLVFNRVTDGGWRETWLHHDEANDLADWLYENGFGTDAHADGIED